MIKIISFIGDLVFNIIVFASGIFCIYYSIKIANSIAGFILFVFGGVSSLFFTCKYFIDVFYYKKDSYKWWKLWNLNYFYYQEKI